MMRPLLTALLFLVLSAASLNAQESITWEDFVDRMTADDTDPEGTADNIIFEDLYELHCNPFNINAATEEQLTQLPFLTLSQCRDILYHIATHGPMLTLGELMAIQTLNAETRSWLHLFCYAGRVENDDKTTLADIIRQSDNELTLRTDIPFYTKAGYADLPQSELEKSPNKVYRGNSLYHSLRYRFTSIDRIDIGLQMEKDPGERGIDYISGYAIVSNIGALRTAALGNYRVSFGQGLVVNTGSSFGKLMTLNTLDRMDRGIRRHSSTSETGYFTGAATTLDLSRHLSASAFYSNRKEDATLLSDSTGVSSLKTDGLHRTALEHSKKGNITTQVIGGNINLTLSHIALSLTAAHTHYSRPLRPKHDTPSSLYRLYNAHGTDFTTYGLAYAYTAPHLTFRGETAMSHNGALATVNSAQWTASPNHQLTAIYRNYAAQFVSPHGHSFGENSRPQNEHALYLGWTTTALRNATLQTYIDLIHHPWLKHQVSSSSYSIDATVQLTQRLNKKSTLAARYKIKTKQKDHKYDTNTDNPQTTLHLNTSHNLRLQWQYRPNKQITLRTTVSATLKQLQTQTTAKGILLSQNLRLTPRNKQGRAELTLTYFNTDSYDSRISIYEPTLLYTFGFRTLHNHGIRTSLLTSLPLGQLLRCNTNLTLNAHLANTLYFGQNTIGTALELIPQNHRTDLQVQLKWKF